MIRLSSATRDPIIRHQKIEARNYFADGAQRQRIIRTRRMLEGRVYPGACIVDVGCGSGDICGPYSWNYTIRAYETNYYAIQLLHKRFPSLNVSSCDIESATDSMIRGDILVATEILEHLNDPVGFISRIMPRFRHAIISHPVDESEHGNPTNGEHRWSFNDGDFECWFSNNGFKISEKEEMKVGPFRILLAAGYRT